MPKDIKNDFFIIAPLDLLEPQIPVPQPPVQAGDFGQNAPILEVESDLDDDIQIIEALEASVNDQNTGWKTLFYVFVLSLATKFIY